LNILGFQPKSFAAGVESKAISFIIFVPIAGFAPGKSVAWQKQILLSITKAVRKECAVAVVTHQNSTDHLAVGKSFATGKE
jgi:hypothetical protein